ncbi:hypothetical protein [Chloroflexus sp.]|uniref:hypothetical protein n=1 Tax=Chloroflexus sp. TaxID=1904827 RepID=UPI002ACDE599|nr:hypothetical protein [Chloroflexus sp.]
MKTSEFVRGIPEADAVLERLLGFACTEKGCEEKWVSCGRVGEEKTRELLAKLRELGLPDPSAELGKVVGRPVTLHDLCAFSGTYRLYLDCASPRYASEERCREGFQRVLEEARERLKNIPGLKKRLENLLAKLDGVDRFELRHDFSTGLTELWFPLVGCGTLGLRYSLSSKNFEVAYYPSHEGPLAWELGEWLAETVEGTLGGLGLGGYRTIVDYGVVATWLPGLDLDTAFRLFGLFADLVPLLNETCVALSVRRVAEKTGVRVKV